MTKQCIRARISGRVQGVYYRATTQTKAQALGLTGWVRNLPTGEVELVACGEAAQLASLQAWLWQGPAGAQVTDVVVTSEPPQVFKDFEILY